MSIIALTNKQETKIKRAIKALNDIRRELARDNPDQSIEWFLEDNDNLNLMEDHSHNERGVANYDSVIKVFDLDHSSGGGW